MEAARLVADKKLSLDEAVALYGDLLPRSQIYARAKSIENGTPVNRPGRPTVLSDLDEAWLAAWVKLLFKYSVPITRTRLMLKAREIAELRKGKFNGPNGMPGKNWWKGFCR